MLYLALAPKSNSVVAALEKLDRALERWPNLEVPDHLRDRHYRPDIEASYLYPHRYPHHFVAQRYAPNELDGETLYEPSSEGSELEIQTLHALRRTVGSDDANSV